MTKGSGLSHSANEKDPQRISNAIKQMLEGRSNDVGMVTLTHDGTATTTTVSAPNCSPSSVVGLFPLTDWAAAAHPTTYVQDADISAGQFIITHQPTSNATETFGWLCRG